MIPTWRLPERPSSIKCSSRSWPSIITGSGYDDFNGPFTFVANSIMFPNAENVVFVNYLNGFSTKLIMYIDVGSDGSIQMRGNYIDSNQLTGWFSSTGGFGKDFKFPLPEEPVYFTPPVLPCTKVCASEGDGYAQCVKVNQGGERTTCECSPGFTNFQDTICRDNNECATGKSSCQYNNCINLPGTYYCAAETYSYYAGFYIVNGVRYPISFNNFIAFPKMSGIGYDQNGQFTILGQVQSLIGIIKVTKTYSNGQTSQMTIYSQVGSSIAGKFTEGNVEGTIIMELQQEYKQEMYESQHKFSGLFDGVFYGDQPYSLNIFWTMFPEPTGYGKDAYGSFNIESLGKSIFSNNQATLNYVKQYGGWSVEISETLNFGNVITVSSNYKVIHGTSSTTKNWSGSQMSGSKTYYLYQGSGYIQNPTSVSGHFIFGDSSNNLEDFNSTDQLDSGSSTSLASWLGTTLT